MYTYLHTCTRRYLEAYNISALDLSSREIIIMYTSRWRVMLIVIIIRRITMSMIMMVMMIIIINNCVDGIESCYSLCETIVVNVLNFIHFK